MISAVLILLLLLSGCAHVSYTKWVLNEAGEMVLVEKETLNAWVGSGKKTEHGMEAESVIRMPDVRLGGSGF